MRQAQTRRSIDTGLGIDEESWQGCFKNRRAHRPGQEIPRSSISGKRRSLDARSRLFRCERAAQRAPGRRIVAFRPRVKTKEEASCPAGMNTARDFPTSETIRRPRHPSLPMPPLDTRPGARTIGIVISGWGAESGRLIMQTPRVLIFERSTFNRRLMSDLVECNDMKAVSVDGSDWVDRLEKGSDRASVVVVDLDQPRRFGHEVVRRLNALPVQHRPRIVGLIESTKNVSEAGPQTLGCEEVIERPLDTGSFARAVCRQALEARRYEMV